MSFSDSLLLSEKYKQMTDQEHILNNPDTYIGSVEKMETVQWIFQKMEEIIDETETEIETETDAEKKIPPKKKQETNQTHGSIVEKNIMFVPGLNKLFDEGIVNCRDHAVRLSQAIINGATNILPVTYIDIGINTSEQRGMITMMNDGNGIDVAQHPEHKIWIPELIFGHLRTSTNYDKKEKKIVGGKNGFGFKLVLIWSTYGSIETVDHIRGLKYFQEFKDNLQVICPPVITNLFTSNKKNNIVKPYTKITFVPDYARLQLPDGITPDIFALFQKRVVDIAAITDKTIKVKFNSQLVPVKQFANYIHLYIGQETKRVYELNGERWEYAVALSPTHEFVQISFVNGIYTTKGGKHVEYILNQILRKMSEYIEQKKKVKVSQTSIKEQLMLFLRCDIENPSFDSQTKDCLNTPPAKFGSKCDVSTKFIENLAKLGIMETACKIAEVREIRQAKKNDGWKTKHVHGIPKLIDANFAGTEKSKQCILILCEGDSAKAGILSGLTAEARNIYGVYPMKGKILNVRGESAKRLSENKEITEIKKVLGLEIGKTYTTIADVHRFLRYGKVLFMTDQDMDGSHIKGLLINLFFSEWPSLVQLSGFLGFMNTPILKATKPNKPSFVFYNEGEFQRWKESTNEATWRSYTIKYFKGLGTSTGKEFGEYFQQQKMVWFDYTGKESDEAIDMVFNKKRAADRKKWLEDYYSRTSFLDTSKLSIPYEEFIRLELIHFSKYDNDRSIPNLMDGLKVSQRKILYAAFKKNFVHAEIKVAHFSGYVSEHSGYHHG